MIEGGRPLSGRLAQREQERRAADPRRRLLTDEPVCSATCRASATSRRCSSCSPTSAPRSSGRAERGAGARRRVSPDELDAKLSERIRASFLLAGPLLARFGRRLPPPGGDVIGRRRVDPHFLALAELGAEVEFDRALPLARSRSSGARHLPRRGLGHRDRERPHGRGARARQTMITNAACEPHVQDLCRFLVALGAEIEGIGSNVLRITRRRAAHRRRVRIGARPHRGRLVHRPGRGDRRRRHDRRTSSRTTCARSALSPPRRRASRSGTTGARAAGSGAASSTTWAAQIPKIDDGPWPAFPADLTSIAVAVATQAHGTVLIFEKMFENRLFFVDKLVGMGARIILCDPHRAVVNGPAQLYGQRLSSPDIRAGMAMLIAALCAEGTAMIGDVDQIDRGYERIDERLRALGARIERVEAFLVAGLVVFTGDRLSDACTVMIVGFAPALLGAGWPLRVPERRRRSDEIEITP